MIWLRKALHAVHKGGTLLPRCTSRTGVRSRKRRRALRRKVRQRTDSFARLGIVGTFASTSGKSIMGKIVLFFGLVTGAAIFMVALIGAPAGSEVAAHEAQPATGCHVEQFALDEGYGVSRQIARHVCPGT
ncbi:hypothetical protein CWB41_10250 [Methylovirgula ligni]|nr:hypothetical protein CWB41_10250 [Methylovirgula ligni]